MSLVSCCQGENKKMEDAKFYLTLPSTKMEVEDRDGVASKLHTANFTLNKDSTKDSFQIATLICSTKLTQNGRFSCGQIGKMAGTLCWDILELSHESTITKLGIAIALCVFCNSGHTSFEVVTTTLRGS